MVDPCLRITPSSCQGKALDCLQVEMNTISSSFGCLCTLVSQMHRFMLHSQGAQQQVTLPTTAAENQQQCFSHNKRDSLYDAKSSLGPDYLVILPAVSGKALYHLGRTKSIRQANSTDGTLRLLQSIYSLQNTRCYVTAACSPDICLFLIALLLLCHEMCYKVTPILLAHSNSRTGWLPGSKHGKTKCLASVSPCSQCVLGFHEQQISCVLQSKCEQLVPCKSAFTSCCSVAGKPTGTAYSFCLVPVLTDLPTVSHYLCLLDVPSLLLTMPTDCAYYSLLKYCA